MACIRSRTGGWSGDGCVFLLRVGDTRSCLLLESYADIISAIDIFQIREQKKNSILNLFAPPNQKHKAPGPNPEIFSAQQAHHGV